MPSRLALVFLLTLLGADVHAQSRPADAATGVLIGLRYQEPISKVPPYYAGRADSLSRSNYHTLLIVQREGKISLVGGAEGLIIPRSNAFWRVGAKRSVYNNWVEDFIWSAPDGRLPKLPGIQPYNGEHCEGSRAQRILYAGENFMTLEQYSAGYCEGAAHPWLFNTLAVVPHDSTTHMGLFISDILGEAAGDALFSAAAQYRAGLRTPEQRARYAEEPDEANWGVTRREGRWLVVGRLDAASEVAQGAYADFEVPVSLPSAIAERAPLYPEWSRVKAFAPDVVDAFTSPGRDFIVIVQRTRLTVHPLKNGEIGTAALTLRLRPETRPVMARWATGARLQRWSERINRNPSSFSAGRR